MKRLILLFFLTFITLTDYAQDYSEQDASNTIIGIFGGGGLATKNNYDVALSGGLDFNKGVAYRTGIGFSIFYQQISIYYNNEGHGEKDVSGNAGATVFNQSGYVFFAPKFFHSLGRERLCKFYLDGGVGYLMSGNETLHKWDKTYGNAPYGSAPYNYDSVINTTPNIKQLVGRIGIGFTEYLHMGGRWWMTLTEDMGFLMTSVSTTSDADNPSRTYYTPHNLSPGYISFQIGIAHTKY